VYSIKKATMRSRTRLNSQKKQFSVPVQTLRGLKNHQRPVKSRQKKKGTKKRTPEISNKGRSLVGGGGGIVCWGGGDGLGEERRPEEIKKRNPKEQGSPAPRKERAQSTDSGLIGLKRGNGPPKLWSPD